MKKVLFLILVLGISVGVFAADITLDYISMHGSGGTGDNTAAAGETISVQLQYDTVAMESVQGAYLSTSNLNKIRIYWYDGNDPGTSSYLSGTNTDLVESFTPDGVGTDKICTFTYNVPTGAGVPTGAESFQIMLGLYGEDEDFNTLYGTRYISDTAESSYTVPGGGIPTNWYSFIDYVADTSTQSPTLTTPSSNSMINDSFDVEFNLPETAADGTVKLSFTRYEGEPDSDTHVLIVASESSGDHSCTLDATDLGSSSCVTLESGSNNTLNSGAIYTIKIEYQDLAQNTAASASNNGVTYANDYIEMTGGDYNAGASFSPSSTNNPYFWGKFKKTASGNAFTVTAIEFDGTGSMATSDVDKIKLWSSTSSTFDGTASELKEITTGYDPLNFTNLSISVNEDGIYIYLTVDVSSTAESTDNIGAAILVNDDVDADAIVNGAPINGGDHALPVTLTSFQAIKVNDNVVLEWETESESNNSHWNVYRSPSANFGQAISINSTFIEAAGFSTEPVFYNFQDEYELQLGATYWYWIECVAYNGLTDLMTPTNIFLDFEYDDGNENEIPEEFGLFQNMPNPFNPETNISFVLEESSNVDLSIYNIKGQKIINLYSGNVVKNDEKTFLWSGKDASGKVVGSGIYFYILKTADKTFTNKMLLTK